MRPSIRRGGRYDNIRDAVDPGPALPKVRIAGRVETVRAAVEDPNRALGEKLQRQKVSVNRLCDPLECERSYGRISEPAYLAGRAYMRVCEAGASRVGGSAFEPSDGAGSHELAIGYAMERSAAVVDMQIEVQSALGQWAALVLRGVLQDGHTFREMAVVSGLRRREGPREIAIAFREGLEDLARYWDRTGWPRVGRGGRIQ